ncbi:MAG: hypothetical protein HYU52_17060 [Acidobacteria bacterium]|nr:hypothetical protein [Acidobacteriota bacterium]
MPIRAVHVSELRASLGAARASLGLSILLITDSPLVPGVTGIKVTHILELRDGAS